MEAGFCANSEVIKTATEQLNLGNISIWRLLQDCSKVSVQYERSQQYWAIHNVDAVYTSDEEVEPIDVKPEESVDVKPEPIDVKPEEPIVIPEPIDVKP